MAADMIRGFFRDFKHRLREAGALAEIAARPETPGRDHGLPSELIVSLTSYPPRFPTLAPTVRSLLRQTVRPDRVILWLGDGDERLLPAEIAAMPDLEVHTCPNWRSYKKIVPTLLKHPDAYVVTADDDIYYSNNWLEQMIPALDQGASIVCLRAHRIRMDSQTRPAGYEAWEHNIPAPEAGALVFPTGVSGVLYAPRVFHLDVTRSDLFMKFAPTADDVWLYWMHRMAGSRSQKVGGRTRILEWSGSQATSLRTENRKGSGNDDAITALLNHYGWPA